MVRTAIVAAVFSAGLVLPSLANAQKQDKQYRKLLELTPTHFAETATVEGDDLDAIITVDTSEGYQRKQGLFSQAADDVFLRAFVSKSSGEALFQVYYQVTYRAQNWANIRSASYLLSGDLKSADTSSLHHDVECSASGCGYLEIVGFMIPESDLAALASRYATDGEPMRVRFRTQHGEDFDTVLTPAEAAGLMEVVDGIRER